MEELFTKETLAMVFSLLEKVSGDSAIVLVSYFALPAIMLLITTAAWLYFGVTAVKMTHSAITKYLSQERTTINKVNVGNGCVNVETFKEFEEVINNLITEMGSTSYLHDSGVRWLKQAVENQKTLNKEYKSSNYNPYVYTSSKGDTHDKTK